MATTINITTSPVTITFSGAQGAAGGSLTNYSQVAALTGYPSAFPTTVANINTIGASKLIGRHTGSTGVGQEIGIDGGLEFHGGNLRVTLSTATGTLPLDHGGTGATTAVDALANIGAAGRGSILSASGTTVTISETHHNCSFTGNLTATLPASPTKPIRFTWIGVELELTCSNAFHFTAADGTPQTIVGGGSYILSAAPGSTNAIVAEFIGTKWFLRQIY